MIDNLQSIVVFGSGTIQPSDPIYQLAYQAGFQLGRLGFTHICGGYGGTMEAGAKGARMAGAKTIGVTVESWGPPNPHIIENIAMPSLFARIEKLMELADAYVVLPGGTGTLIELATAWERINKKIDPVKPILLLTDFWLPVINLLKTQLPKVQTKNPPDDLKGIKYLYGEFLVIAESAESAAQLLKYLAKKR